MDAAKMMSALRRVDERHYNRSAMSRVHPLAHLIVTLCFIVSAASFPKYAAGTLMLMPAYPVMAIVAACIPAGMIIKRVAAVMPLAFFMGVFNPLLDRNVAVLAGIPIPAGWVSFFTLMLKCALTVSAALILICVTGIDGVCASLRLLRVPVLIVAQISFTYRYIHVLGAEIVHVLCAFKLRSAGKRGVSPAQFGSMCGSLFLRSAKRAGDIYAAMLCRGFNGIMPAPIPKHFSRFDVIYTFLWVCAFGFFRWLA